MVCAQCDAQVTEDQRFCNKCGAALTRPGAVRRDDPTDPDDPDRPDATSTDTADPDDTDRPDATSTDTSDPDDTTTVDPDAADDATDPDGTARPDTTAIDDPDDTTAIVDPDDPDRPGDPGGTDRRSVAVVRDGSQSDPTVDAGPPLDPTVDEVVWGSTTDDLVIATAPTTDTALTIPPLLDDGSARVAHADTASAGADVGSGSDPSPSSPSTTVAPATPPPAPPIVTTEQPLLFDGLDDVAHLPEPRQTARLRLVFVLAFFGAIAGVMATAADVTDVFTTRPIDGIDQGVRVLEDFGTNLPVAVYTGSAVMVLGGLLACFGFRWAAGLAGGAGLALVGWAGLVLGLAEIPIERAVDITRNPTTPEPFTLTVTRDVGWWLILAVAGLGLLVFLASLRMSGTGRRRSLNPWIAAVGALSTLVLAVGPLVPTGNATFADNFDWSDSALPPAIFVGRLVQVGLIALAGVLGFLLVRAYGLGLAVGGVSVGLWLWISSLGELGADPRGIADRNPGATDTIPHGVTTIGAILTISLIVLAVVVATLQRQRPAQERRRPTTRVAAPPPRQRVGV